MNRLKKIIKFYISCWKPQRGNSLSESIANFYVPKMDAAFGVRVATIVILGYMIFSFVLTPMFINGASMEPTYFRRGFNFCWRGKYLFSEPEYGDIVIIKFTDDISLLKRIIGLPGDVIFIRNGVLYLNGRAQKEDYVKNPCDWNLPPRKISPGHVYVIGDNRSMPIERHMFGEVKKKRIIGGPLW
jgi:signal peptidase I